MSGKHTRDSSTEDMERAIIGGNPNDSDPSSTQNSALPRSMCRYIVYLLGKFLVFRPRFRLSNKFRFWPPVIAKCLVWATILAMGFLFLLQLLFPAVVILLGTIIAPVVAMPLLLLALPVTRYLQFIRSDYGFDRALHLKYIIFTLIFLAMLEFMVVMGICFPIAKFAPPFKHVLLMGLPLTNWIVIAYMLCGFYALGYCLNLIMHGMLQYILYRWGIVCSIYIREAVCEMMDCLIFWWALSEVVHRVPAFKQHQVFGLQTRKWIVAATFAFLGHDSIALCTHVIAWFIRSGLRALGQAKPNWYMVLEGRLLHREYMVYCAYGMRRSICFIFSSVLLLLMWILYFGSHLKRTVEGKRVLDFGTWTFSSVLICSLLWLIKCCVLLAWKATAVHIRLYNEIVEHGKNLYFLGLLGRHEYDVLNLLHDNEASGGVFHLVLEIVGKHNKHLPSSVDKKDSWGGKLHGKKLSTQKRKMVKDELLLRNPTLYDIQVAAQHFLRARGALSREEYVYDMLNYLKNIDPTRTSRELTEDDIKKLIIIRGENDENNQKNGAQSSSDHPSRQEEEDDWVIFEDMLKNVLSTMKTSKKNTPPDDISRFNPSTIHEDLSEENITFEEKFGTWIEKAHQKCLFLANTVISGKDAVDCLNTIMSLVIISATFVMWLLVTRLASTKVLVLIASPSLAATFIFGETCKNLFQGIIFVYVVHPYDVGDTCNIGEDQKLLLVVKRIGVWETTFAMTDDKADLNVIYPNSELAKLRIINHKIKFHGLSKQTETDPEVKRDTMLRGNLPLPPVQNQLLNCLQV